MTGGCVMGERRTHLPSLAPLPAAYCCSSSSWPVLRDGQGVGAATPLFTPPPPRGSLALGVCKLHSPVSRFFKSIFTRNAEPPASTFVLPPVAAVSLKAPRRYGPSPLGLRATAISRALIEWASTRWPVWVVRRCRNPTLRMAPLLRSASSSSSNETSNASRNSSRRNVAPLAGCPLFKVCCVRISCASSSTFV